MKSFASLLFAGFGLWAGEFQNFNFEAGNPANVHPQPGKSFLLGPTAELLPGWRVQYGNAPVDEVFYAPQGGPGFCCGVALREVPAHVQPFFGQYLLSVDPVTGPGPDGQPIGMPITLSQTGQVPADAHLLGFMHPVFDPEIRINGQLTLWDRQTATLDVSRYAGQEIELSFTFLPNKGESFEIYGFTSVPEPEMWALLAVGGLALGWHCWRQKQL